MRYGTTGFEVVPRLCVMELRRSSNEVFGGCWMGRWIGSEGRKTEDISMYRMRCDE